MVFLRFLAEIDPNYDPEIDPNYDPWLHMYVLLLKYPVLSNTM